MNKTKALSTIAEVELFEVGKGTVVLTNQTKGEAYRFNVEWAEPVINGTLEWVMSLFEEDKKWLPSQEAYIELLTAIALEFTQHIDALEELVDEAE